MFSPQPVNQDTVDLSHPSPVTQKRPWEGAKGKRDGVVGQVRFVSRERYKLWDE